MVILSELVALFNNLALPDKWGEKTISILFVVVIFGLIVAVVKLQASKADKDIIEKQLELKADKLIVNKQIDDLKEFIAARFDDFKTLITELAKK